jgi:hypothetical protein
VFQLDVFRAYGRNLEACRHALATDEDFYDWKKVKYAAIEMRKDIIHCLRAREKSKNEVENIQAFAFSHAAMCSAN